QSLPMNGFPDPAEKAEQVKWQETVWPTLPPHIRLAYEIALWPGRSVSLPVPPRTKLPDNLWPRYTEPVPAHWPMHCLKTTRATPDPSGDAGIHSSPKKRFAVVQSAKYYSASSAPGTAA